ncbi:MAG TPA: hypothetical protein VN419_12275 [Humidesulfovibrio sp.]|uniref:hypothetical protein n=1 Tax=Humidesulfovibrio sp. TaxID=2910988 RepID=UPI002BC0AC4E|nr:hypothetical protein [Humidesulfovibrio sp.]HWR04779.1 hypothetical protein [Humidesulfovibrio sp.]
MVPMLSEVWRLAAYLLRPEGIEREESIPSRRTPQGAALAGFAKVLLWACLSVLLGFGLARLK